MASGFHLVFFLCMTSGLLIAGTHSFFFPYGRVQRCPSGWRQFGSRCFIFQTSLRTMADAESRCIAIGGNLASIHSLKEYQMIRQLIFKRCGSYANAWIGSFDAIQEKRWMWTDGSKFGYAYWGRGEPNNLRQEHCTEINWRVHYWNDIKCHERRRFVCARKL